MKRGARGWHSCPIWGASAPSPRSKHGQVNVAGTVSRRPGREGELAQAMLRTTNRQKECEMSARFVKVPAGSA